MRAFEGIKEMPMNHFSEMVIRLCDFRASVSNGTFGSMADIFSYMQSMEAELKRWFVNISPGYKYTTVAAKANNYDDAYAEHCHVYPNHSIAGLINNYRCIRAILNDKILDCLSDNPSLAAVGLAPHLHNAQRKASKAVILELAHDVCASVPFYFAFHKALGGVFLRWPLYMVASLRNIPDSMREWVIRQMHKITHIMGIRQAAAMADYLKVGTI